MGVFTNVAGVSPSLYQRAMRPRTNGRELSRLVTAAVVNQGFRNILLANPESALASGYNGEVFYLGTEDQDAILSIRAATLADFAMQLATHQNGNGKHNGNGNRRNL